jgi:hypothetical protein
MEKGLSSCNCRAGRGSALYRGSGAITELISKEGRPDTPSFLLPVSSLPVNSSMSREPSLPDFDLSDDDQHIVDAASNRKRSSRGTYPTPPP